MNPNTGEPFAQRRLPPIVDAQNTVYTGADSSVEHQSAHPLAVQSVEPDGFPLYRLRGSATSVSDHGTRSRDPLELPSQEETTMNQRLSVGRVVCVCIAVVVSTPSVCRWRSPRPRRPRRRGGIPDLQGVWDFRSITPMERPEELGDKAFLTEEEAARLEQEAIDRNDRAAEPSRPSGRRPAAASMPGTDGSPGFYNNFWLDRGTKTVGTRRTSLIVDPPNGRVPPLTAGGRPAAGRPWRGSEQGDGHARAEPGGMGRGSGFGRAAASLHHRVQFRPPDDAGRL